MSYHYSSGFLVVWFKNLVNQPKDRSLIPENDKRNLAISIFMKVYKINSYTLFEIILDVILRNQ